MRRKRVRLLSTFILIVFLFSLLLTLSWTNSYAVQEKSAAISPFSNLSPFMVGILILGLIFLLVVLALEKHN